MVPNKADNPRRIDIGIINSRGRVALPFPDKLARLYRCDVGVSMDVDIFRPPMTDEVLKKLLYGWGRPLTA
jgi:hypothetical protein